MGERYEVRLGGSGGQGIILSGIILAEALGLYGGKFVVQTQSYGPEARGGASRADVVVSDEEIDYPKAIKLDLLLAMNQKSCDEYYRDLKEDGILVVDSTFVTQVPTSKAIQIPFTKIAREKFHREIVANIISLGAITELTNIISHKFMEAAVLARVPKGTEKLNRDALKAGVITARKVKESMRNEDIQPQEFQRED
ncbi:MAG: 2-oxoacid:acceptor oxidoreductase family protein [Syntrophobacterales bacterium]|nr:MAG: 2-oxoacid:acceptor oxidoreductase family protein [Syntrophobacterales bacterium]